MANKQNTKKSGATAPHVHTKHLRYSWKAGLVLLVLLIIFIGLTAYLYNYGSDKAVVVPQTTINGR